MATTGRQRLKTKDWIIADDDPAVKSYFDDIKKDYGHQLVPLEELRKTLDECLGELSLSDYVIAMRREKEY